jgi:hypothetical protein
MSLPGSDTRMDRKSQLWGSCSRDEPLRVDKRAGRRSILRVPIVAKWRGDREYEVKGVTRDLNDNGVFFHAEADIPLGAAVELRFTLHRPFTAPETFHFTGTVVRIEPSKNSAKGFAVQVSTSELLRQQSESPTEILPSPTRKASWFGFDVTPRRIESPQKEGPEAQQHPPSHPAADCEPKLVLEWEPRWRNFVSSVRPAVARSAARLEAECDRTLALVHGPFTSLILHCSAVVLLFLPFDVVHSSRVRINNPIGKGSEVIYFSGPYLPELQDRGGAQFGRSGASGGSQSSNTQSIRVARGPSLAKMNADSAKLYLPPSAQPVSNLLAMTPNKRDPSLVDRLGSLFETRAVPAEKNDTSASPKEKERAKPPEAHKSTRNEIRAPYRRVRKESTFKRTQEARRAQIKNDPSPAKQESAVDSVVKALSSAVNSVTGATPSAPAVVVSTQPGNTLGLPTTPKSGPLAMSPEGGARGGLGGSGNGSGIGSGNGPGRAQAGSGPGSSLADTGSGSDPFRGKSPAPGLGGAGKTDSEESNGVSIQGATVTVRSFGSSPPSDKIPGRSKYPRARSESTPTVTVVSSSRSGGAMGEYGALRGTKVYSIYIATARGPAVLQYSEHSPSGEGFEDDLTTPEPMNTEVPSGFTSKRFVVACMIDRSGLLRNFRVLESNASEPIARMFSVLGGWRFRPALRDTEPVEIDAILGFNIDAH